MIEDILHAWNFEYLFNTSLVTNILAAIVESKVTQQI